MSFSFNSQIQRGAHETKYSIQVETNNKDQFKFIEKIARECIDGKHKPIKVKVKKSAYPRCYKCVWQLDCTQTKDFEHKCPDYVKDAPDDSKAVITGTIPAEERNTLQIHNCNRIVLTDKSLDFSFEINNECIEQFNKIIINGIVFEKKVK